MNQVRYRKVKSGDLNYSMKSSTIYAFQFKQLLLGTKKFQYAGWIFYLPELNTDPVLNINLNNQEPC